MKKTAKSKKKQILLIEDGRGSAAHAELLRDSLAVLVDVVENGEAALTQLKKKQYDLIITEFLAPIVNAPELCKALSGDPDLSRIPVLMVSILPLQSPQFQRSLTTYPHFRNVRGVLQKPMRKEMLVTEVSMLLAVT